MPVTSASRANHGSNPPPPHRNQSPMGFTVSKHAEDAVSESSPTDTVSQSGNESTGTPVTQAHPTIIVTPPSREDLLAPDPGKTIPLAIREARPGVPIAVGRRPFPGAKA
ncbi:hypothetical protein JZ751_027085 [Albula glossodonta]|uniref:Uncharacterized protein n=1 Tax=Albula glossodonta TaxID=121402 RepID=A0A8T2NDS2_9TELE|nr:hypothetical protein JZ751_027085 [Albula glossodonta]